MELALLCQQGLRGGSAGGYLHLAMTPSLLLLGEWRVRTRCQAGKRFTLSLDKETIMTINYLLVNNANEVLFCFLESSVNKKSHERRNA